MMPGTLPDCDEDKFPEALLYPAPPPPLACPNGLLLPASLFLGMIMSAGLFDREPKFAPPPILLPPMILKWELEEEFGWGSFWSSWAGLDWCMICWWICCWFWSTPLLEWNEIGLLFKFCEPSESSEFSMPMNWSPLVSSLSIHFSILFLFFLRAALH